MFEEIYNKEIYSGIKDIPWYITLGNTDFYGSANAQVEYSNNKKNWVLPKHEVNERQLYSHSKGFTLNGLKVIQFLFLNTPIFDGTERSEITNQSRRAQVKWWREVFDENSSNFQWRFVVGHNPMVKQ
jgi:hypothetical protein